MSKMIYIVIAEGVWTKKVRGVFSERQAAEQFAVLDERDSDGYHTWKVWEVPLDVPSQHPEGRMGGTGETEFFHADFDPPGETVYEVERDEQALDQRDEYTDMDRTI